MLDKVMAFKKAFLFVISLIFYGCGNGFNIAAHTTAEYSGAVAEYCTLPADFSGLSTQESLPDASQLTQLRSDASTFVNQNKLQEAIWLYQDDPEGTATALSLKEQLRTLLTTGDFQKGPSNLGGAFEKYILTFSNGIQAIYKPTEGVYAEIAPYQLDQFLQLGMIPMVVDRVIEGRRGTVQYLMTGMSGAAINQISSKNFRKMLVLDFLIRNRDRDLTNFLFWSAQNRAVAIDHGASFSLPCGIPNEIKKHLLIEKTFATKIANLTESSFSTGMGDVPVHYQKIIWEQMMRIR